MREGSTPFSPTKAILFEPWLTTEFERALGTSEICVGYATDEYKIGYWNKSHDSGSSVANSLTLR